MVRPSNGSDNKVSEGRVEYSVSPAIKTVPGINPVPDELVGLSPSEQVQRLHELEDGIERGLRDGFLFGLLLDNMLESGAWKELGFKTREEFLQQHVRMSRPRAFQLVIRAKSIRGMQAIAEKIGEKNVLTAVNVFAQSSEYAQRRINQIAAKDPEKALPLVVAAVEQANGSAPDERIVNAVVSQLRQKTLTAVNRVFLGNSSIVTPAPTTPSPVAIPSGITVSPDTQSMTAHIKELEVLVGELRQQVAARDEQIEELRQLLDTRIIRIVELEMQVEDRDSAIEEFEARREAQLLDEDVDQLKEQLAQATQERDYARADQQVAVRSLESAQRAETTLRTKIVHLERELENAKASPLNAEAEQDSESFQCIQAWGRATYGAAWSKMLKEWVTEGGRIWKESATVNDFP